MMDCRVISAFMRVFNALCPAMTKTPYMIDAYAGLRSAANCGACEGSAVRLLVE